MPDPRPCHLAGAGAQRRAGAAHVPCGDLTTGQTSHLLSRLSGGHRRAQSERYRATPFAHLAPPEERRSSSFWPKPAPSTRMPRSSSSTKTSSRTTTLWWLRARHSYFAHWSGAVCAGAQEHWRRAGGSQAHPSSRAGRAVRGDPRPAKARMFVIVGGGPTGVELGSALRDRGTGQHPATSTHQPGPGTRHSRRRFGSRASKLQARAVREGVRLLPMAKSKFDGLTRRSADAEEVGRVELLDSSHLVLWAAGAGR